jgi:hypothetical protein
VTENESFLRKVWRFALGLFGLDSAPPANVTPVVDPSFQEVPNPIPAGGGKGG